MYQPCVHFSDSGSYERSRKVAHGCSCGRKNTLAPCADDCQEPGRKHTCHSRARLYGKDFIEAHAPSKNWAFRMSIAPHFFTESLWKDISDVIWALSFVLFSWDLWSTTRPNAKGHERKVRTLGVGRIVCVFRYSSKLSGRTHNSIVKKLFLPLQKWKSHN